MLIHKNYFFRAGVELVIGWLGWCLIGLSMIGYLMAQVFLNFFIYVAEPVLAFFLTSLILWVRRVLEINRRPPGHH